MDDIVLYFEVCGHSDSNIGRCIKIDLEVDELDSPDGAEYSRKKIAEEIACRGQRTMVTLIDLKNNPRLL